MTGEVGYEYLRTTLHLSGAPPARIARIGSVQRILVGETEITVPAARAPAPGVLLEQVLFALKHEGTQLGLLAQALPHLTASSLRDALRAQPNGRYLRLAGYLWEAFTGSVLDDLPAMAGPVVPVFDPETYVTAPGTRNAKWRVLFNGLGSLRHCAEVRRSPAVIAGLAGDVLGRAQAFANSVEPAMLDRALAWAYLDETRASFEIERESPSPDRAQAFAALLQRAHEPGVLTQDYLVGLQNAVMRNPLERAAAFRHEQNWLGSSLRGPLGVTYVPPPPVLAEELMGALMDFANGPARQVNPVVAAACVSFAFAFIHPFMDGNGRVSRYLFHHALCQSGALSDGLILPVSIAMAKHEAEYLQTLQSFSRPARAAWTVTALGVDDFDFRFDGDPAIYRYWDATACVEFSFRMAEQALEAGLHQEVLFMRRYDAIVRRINAAYDIRGSTLRTLVVSCMELGRLSLNRRAQFALTVPEPAFDFIERVVVDVMAPPSC